MSLDVQDKKWIKNEITESHKQIQRDADCRLGVVLEKMEDDYQLMRELIETRPTREEMHVAIRTAIQQETPQIVREVMREEILPHIVELRDIAENYGVRITNLETSHK